MKLKLLFHLFLVIFVLALSSCENKYENQTFYHTDSYGSVFEGKRVPQDVQ